MSAAEAFNKFRYVYLSGAVSRDDCEQLTKYMFSLHEKGVLEKDPQCPLSDSVYGDEIFDGLAAKLAPDLSKQLGVELIPTYTYCRIYRPGEVLVRHTDRPACEISGTMTLGFDPGSGIWPIWFAKDEDDLVGYPLEINIGDLVMYRGCELPHWRPSYKGKWQVQVFFHYVDANGPYKDEKFDRRPTMGVKKTQERMRIDGLPEERSIQDDIKRYQLPLSRNIYEGVMIRTSDDVFPGAATYNSEFRPDLMFSKEECAKIISIADQKYGHKSLVGGGEDSAYRKEVREVDTYEIDLNDDTAWIFNKIASAVGTANAEHYRYNLLGITHSLQLLHYKGEDEGHYEWHIDAGPGESATRKISISAPLNTGYEGGKLILNNNGVIMEGCEEPGSMTLFPSFMLHKVEKITRGERWALVAWIHGPDRFKQYK